MLVMEFLKKLSEGRSYVVDGSVAPGYEPVREMFEQYFQSGQESRAQLCVYVDQKLVIG